jgi:hypothetical protein
MENTAEATTAPSTPPRPRRAAADLLRPVPDFIEARRHRTAAELFPGPDKTGERE